MVRRSALRQAARVVAPENRLDKPDELRYTLTMTQVALQIPDDLRPFIDRSVESGMFSNASDFLVNLLYNVKAESEAELSEEQNAKLTVLRSKIAIGIEQLRTGQSAEFDAEDIIARGRARLAAKRTTLRWAMLLGRLPCRPRTRTPECSTGGLMG